MSDPLSDEELSQIEARAFASGGWLAADAVNLVAEVRRLRSLFTTEDARMLEAIANSDDTNGFWSIELSLVASLAARIRQASAEPPDSLTP